MCLSYGNIPMLRSCLQSLRELLDHARNFSEVMHGAPLLYNLVLAEQAQRDDGVTEISPTLRRVGAITR